MLPTYQSLESCHKRNWMGRGRCQGAYGIAQSAAQLAGFVKYSCALAPPGVCADVPSRTDRSHIPELSARGETWD